MRNALVLTMAVLVSCGTSATPPAATATPAATSPAGATTSAPATTAPAPRTSPARTAAASRNPAQSEVTLRWDTGANIADVDDITDIVSHLKETDGIVDGFGDEHEITIIYEGQKITVDKIRTLLKDMGFPTKSPEPRP